jgi:hypothetical protein
MTMLFFRSEESLDEWLESRGAARGATLSIDELWELTKRWYQNRMSPEYRGRTAAQAEAIFRDLGLTSPFWRLE